MSLRNQQNAKLIGYAMSGERLVLVDGDTVKTLWAGLGNRSGLHDYAQVLITEKWEKSGERFSKKLAKLPAGVEVRLMDFRNTTRDRGRWIAVRAFKLT